MSDFARWTVAVEMMLLLFCLGSLVALEEEWARRAPKSWRWGLAAVGVALAAVCAAVILNALIADRQTPGVKVTAVVAALADLLAIVGVVKALRRQPTTEAEYREAQVVANAPLLAEALSHLQHLDPCPDPGCIAARRELRALAGEQV